MTCLLRALAVNSLGFDKDATYRLSLRFFIEEPEVRLRFSGRLVSSSGFEPISAESWGLGNVRLEWTIHECVLKRYCQFGGLPHSDPDNGAMQRVVFHIQRSDIATDEAEENLGAALRAQIAAMVVILEEQVEIEGVGAP